MAKPGSWKGSLTAPTPGGVTWARGSLGRVSLGTTASLSAQGQQGSSEDCKGNRTCDTHVTSRKCARCRAQPQAETPGDQVISSSVGNRETSQAPLGGQTIRCGLQPVVEVKWILSHLTTLSPGYRKDKAAFLCVSLGVCPPCAY